MEIAEEKPEALDEWKTVAQVPGEPGIFQLIDRLEEIVDTILLR
jgi:hypothetical protein